MIRIPIVDWHDLIRRYPTGYRFYKERYGHGTGLLTDRDLYDFFDTKGIFLHVFPKRVGGVPGFCWGDDGAYFGEIFLGDDNSNIPVQYQRRTEAEEAAFMKAFQLLDQQPTVFQ